MKTLDKELLDGIRNREEGSFKILYERYGEITLKQIGSRISDADTAKDLYQDFWLSVWTSTELIRTDELGDASKSLFFILSKRILDYYRDQAKRAVDSVGDMENVVDGRFYYSHVLESIIGKEISQLVDQLLGEMPELIS